MDGIFYSGAAASYYRENKMNVFASAVSENGSRPINEDSFIILTGESSPCGTLGLIAVADGIGGRGTGAVASQLTLKSFADVFSAGCSVSGRTPSEVPHLLRFAMQKANAAVFRAQDEEESLRGMGSTCTAAVFTNEFVHVVSVGDSRAYLLRNGTLTMLTHDEWRKLHDGTTVVDRAIGWQPILPIEPSSFAIKRGDRVLLCTDGLTDALHEERIASIMKYEDIREVCTLLAANASLLPGADNVTVIVADISE